MSSIPTAFRPMPSATPRSRSAISGGRRLRRELGLRRCRRQWPASPRMRLRKDAIEHLPGILGRELTDKGRIGEPHAEARELQALAATPTTEAEMKPTCMGFSLELRAGPSPTMTFAAVTRRRCRSSAKLDWAAVEQTKELRRLAVLEEPAIASHRFPLPGKQAVSVPTGQHQRRRSGFSLERQHGRDRTGTAAGGQSRRHHHRTRRQEGALGGRDREVSATLP